MKIASRLSWFFVLIALLLGIGYVLRRHIFARVFRLSAPTYRVNVVEGIRVVMPDSISLATDHYQPQPPNHKETSLRFPTVLIRSPYGRGQHGGPFGCLMRFVAFRFAERGYNVIIQDTRGRADSEGEFDPYFHEREDGLATLQWIANQPWYDGHIGLWGGSYLGIVQWVIADSPFVQAIVPAITTSQLRQIVFPDGVLDLGLALRWMGIFHELDQCHTLFDYLTLLHRLEHNIRRAELYLPTVEADIAICGKPVPFFRKWITHAAPTDPLWQIVQNTILHHRIHTPVHLIGGWYDFFLRGLLHDYHALCAAGHSPYLTIGPWTHFSSILTLSDLREGLIWMDAHLKSDRSQLRSHPVHIYVMGAEEWRDLDTWPPPSQTVKWYLHDLKTLSQDLPGKTESVESFIYDPTNPTPALGGPQFSLRAGRRDNHRLEIRSDVLTFTSDPLSEDLEIIGPVNLELYIRPSLENADLFGRLCDVYPNGRSYNICDGLIHLTPEDASSRQTAADGSFKVSIDLWATAYRFKAGHCLRLLIAGGAHPRWNRNAGVPDSLHATKLVPCTHLIWHDACHPSALHLPVVSI